MGDREAVEASDAISVEGTDLTKENGTEEIEIFKEQSYESIPALHSYQIKPSLLERFKAAPVKEIIRNVQAEVLTGKTYTPENAKKWSIKIANEVNKRCKDIKMRRYKHIAQVILGELKGAGVKSVVRCVWDSETDGYTSDIFMNDTITAKFDNSKMSEQGEMKAEETCVSICQAAGLANQSAPLNFFEKPCYEKVKDVIRSVQSEILTGKTYSSEDAKKWSTDIVNEVNKRLRDLKMRKYKHIVQVILAELKGAGLKTVIKSVWDAETDGLTSENFLNETIMCFTVVFTILLY